MTENSNIDRVSSDGSSNTPETSPSVKSRQFLFINQYSTDQALETHGPGREAIGSYVQRTIQARKRLERNQRLRSSISNSTIQAGRRQNRQLRPLRPLSVLHDDMIVGSEHTGLSKNLTPSDGGRESSEGTLQATFDSGDLI